MSKLIGGEIIGIGTYGCVYKPQMECAVNRETADDTESANTVSKFMLDTDATKEMDEFIAVANADSNKRIHLGTPDKCAIKDTTANKDEIDVCINVGHTHFPINKTKLGDYALLIMKDGGQDLYTFGIDIYRWADTLNNKNKMELFWLEVSRLFYGLKVFKDAGLVHHDINHNNIVYNIDANRLNFIDFGLMTKKKVILDAVENRTYSYPKRWSLPWEISDLKPAKYKAHPIANYSRPEVLPYILATNSDFLKVILPIDVNSPEADRIKNEMSKKYHEQVNLYIASQRFIHLNKSIDTTDSYGVGLALLYILNRSRHLIGSVFGNNLNALFTNMISPLAYERHDVDTLIAKYNNIMTDSRLLEKHKMHYDENFLLVNNDEPTPAPPAIVNDEDPPALPAIVNDDKDPPALPAIVPGGRHRPRARKSYKISKSTRHSKSSKRVRSRKAHKAKRSHKKR
jgi:serine/threonine protein kinase